MTFEYLQRIVVDAELTIDNIGDCVVVCNNDLGEEFYLIIKTELGWTEVLEYGPYAPDFEQLPVNYSVKYSRFEFSQFKLERLIDKFLNDGKRAITQARVTELAEVYDNLVNPIDKVFPTKGGIFDD